MVDFWQDALVQAFAKWWKTVVSLEGFVAVFLVLVWVFWPKLAKRLQRSLKDVTTRLHWKMPIIIAATWFLWCLSAVIYETSVNKDEQITQLESESQRLELEQRAQIRRIEEDYQDRIQRLEDDKVKQAQRIEDLRDRVANVRSDPPPPRIVKNVTLATPERASGESEEFPYRLILTFQTNVEIHPFKVLVVTDGTIGDANIIPTRPIAVESGKTFSPAKDSVQLRLWNPPISPRRAALVLLDSEKPLNVIDWKMLD